jgi:hypothetical protein
MTMTTTKFRKRVEDIQLGSGLAAENNDCTVRAFALLTDAPYETARAYLRAFGRGNRRRMYSTELLRAFDLAGFDLKELPFKAKTAVTATREAQAAGGRVLISITGHVFAVIDGHVDDWADNRRTRFENAWRVVPRTNRRAVEKQQALIRGKVPVLPSL